MRRAALMMAALGGLGLGLLAQAGAPVALPAFDAASVKPFQVPPRGWAWGPPKMDPEHFRIAGAPLRDIIRDAYGLDDYQLTGLPDWAGQEFYTIVASTAQPAAPAAMLRMLRRLLAERFHLQVEESRQQGPVWALVAAPGGPRLRALKAEQACADGISREDMKAAGAPIHAMSSFDGCTIDDLVRAFNRPGHRQRLGRPVIDKSGITGRYAMLVWQSVGTEERTPTGGFKVSDMEPFREAVEKELGLKLVADQAELHFVKVVQVARPGPD